MLFRSVFVFVFCCLGLHQWHMEVPRLGVELELQPLAYATATAMQDPSHVCNLHHSSWQCQILNPLTGPGVKSEPWLPAYATATATRNLSSNSNPLNKARDRTRNLMVPSQICSCCATTGTPVISLLNIRYILNFIPDQVIVF